MAVDVERRVARTLLRAFIREVKRVGPVAVRLTPALQLSDWGRGAHVTLPSVPELQVACFPGVDFVGAGCAGLGEFHRHDILRVIRHEFRLPRTAGAAGKKASPIDAGFAHLRSLLQLVALSECTTRFVSRYGERAKVAVEVTTMFRTDTFNPKGGTPPIRMDDDTDSDSDLEEGEDGGGSGGGGGAGEAAAVAYPFAYRVRVTNEGEEVRLAAATGGVGTACAGGRRRNPSCHRCVTHRAGGASARAALDFHGAGRLHAGGAAG